MGISIADVMASKSTERRKTLEKLEPTLVNTTPQKLLGSYAMTIRGALFAASVHAEQAEERKL